MSFPPPEHRRGPGTGMPGPLRLQRTRGGRAARSSLQPPTSHDAALRHASRMIRANRCRILLLGLLTAAAPLSGQSIQGVLVEQGTAEPVEGAVVVLLTEAGSQAGGALTDAAGRFQLRAPAAGRYRLRADRIGYRSSISPWLELEAGQTREHRMEARSEAVQLDGITVQGRQRCQIRPREGLDAARVWEEARKALAAAALAQQAELFRFRVRLYAREVDPETGRVRQETERARSGYFAQPFRSLSAERLAEGGFAERGADGGLTYYAPDAAVLLSDAFLETHCFRVAEHPDSAAWVGLAFEPVRGRRLPEIRGAFWLDRRSAELRSLDYHYTNLDLDVPREALGGRVEFAPLPGGAWVVRRWSIRMPVVGIRRSGWGGQRHARHELMGVREEGGEVMEIHTARGELVSAAGGAVLTGTVADSTRSAPLPGARVVIAGTGHAALTDERGRFRLEDLPEGRYAVTFEHPRLDSLGVTSIAPREVDLRPDRETEVDLAIPSMSHLLAAACPAPGLSARESGRMPGDEVGILVGTVRDSVTGQALPGAKVTATWSRYTYQQERGLARTSVGERQAGFEATTDERGRYRMCEVPALIPVRLQASFLGRTGEAVEVRLVRETPTLRDLSLGLASPARLLGRLVDFATSQPIAGATVHLEGTRLEQLTDEQGRFALPDVPPGAHELRISHPAYGTHADSVQIEAGRTAALEIRLPASAVELEGVVATALSRRSQAARVRSTPLRLLDRAEIERAGAGARHIGELVRGLPGATVRESGGDAGAGLCIEAVRRMRSDRTARGCEMVMVYVDDVRMMDAWENLRNLPLADIESIELLAPGEAGARYGTGAGTGVLLIYTRGNGPFARPR